VGIAQKVVLIVAHTISFILQMYLSSSGACLSHPVILSIMPMASNGFLKHSNCPSPRICHTFKASYVVCIDYTF